MWISLYLAISADFGALVCWWVYHVHHRDIVCGSLVQVYINSCFRERSFLLCSKKRYHPNLGSFFYWEFGTFFNEKGRMIMWLPICECRSRQENLPSRRTSGQVGDPIIPQRRGPRRVSSNIWTPAELHDHTDSLWVSWLHNVFSSTISFCFHPLAYKSNLEYWSDVKHFTRIDLFFCIAATDSTPLVCQRSHKTLTGMPPNRYLADLHSCNFFDILRILRSKHFSWPIAHAYAFCRYQAYELIHARWAMLGAAGFVLPEAFNKFGAVCGPEAVWWKVCATS